MEDVTTFNFDDFFADEMDVDAFLLFKVINDDLLEEAIDIVDKIKKLSVDIEDLSVAFV